MAKLINTLYPFGAHCLPLEGEVSEETKRWLLDSERATEADFEKPKKEKAKAEIEQVETDLENEVETKEDVQQEEIKNTKPKK